MQSLVQFDPIYKTNKRKKIYIMRLIKYMRMFKAQLLKGSMNVCNGVMVNPTGLLWLDSLLLLLCSAETI